MEEYELTLDNTMEGLGELIETCEEFLQELE